MRLHSFHLFGGLSLAAALMAGEPAPGVQPLPFRVPARMPDALEMLSPSALHIEGWLGARLQVNERNRLLKVDTVPLLAGFHKKPGSHPWIGEHVGKWMHAATLAWAYTGDPALREKLDQVAAELVNTQEPDGYLGTYVPEKRLGLHPGADWDVWSHKYNLMGLLTYYQYTGNEPALNACRKMGDLLIATFPAKRSILAAGTHVGMAATSVLEPIVLLYRLTGDERYLDFARYIVKSWDEPNGPKIIQALLEAKQVNKTANAKAYEMLSNLVGLCELARATGDRSLLEPLLNAWEDIVAKRLYVTGSASIGEHFPADYVLPNQTSAHVCETCVTTTWIQLNLQLLRLTGEAKFGNELERTFYNHLAAAQHPAGADWCYFTALEGKKPYDSGINCCHSSGPRGMALAPQAACLKSTRGSSDLLAISLFETMQVTLGQGAEAITLRQESQFPRQGQAVISIQTAKPRALALQLRVPAWAAPLKCELNGQPAKTTLTNGWAFLAPREWSERDRLSIQFSLSPRLVLGDHGNKGRAALAWGPFVLACDEAKNTELPPAATLGLVEADPLLELRAGPDLAFAAAVVPRRTTETKRATFVPFADAGASGGLYRVWLRAPGAEAKNDSLLADGQESRSRQGNLSGSINDGDASTFVVTFNSQRAREDWFAVTMTSAITFKRVVFAHGKVFHDGGWFDASVDKPRVQVQRQKGGEWETIGELKDYPATTATDSTALEDGRRFTLKLNTPVQAVAVRVIGVPASGDNSNQAFSSCGELEAFAE
jgi:uncharacterized protein